MTAEEVWHDYVQDAITVKRSLTAVLHASVTCANLPLTSVWRDTFDGRGEWRLVSGEVRIVAERRPRAIVAYWVDNGALDHR